MKQKPRGRVASQKIRYRAGGCRIFKTPPQQKRIDGPISKT